MIRSVSRLLSAVIPSLVVGPVGAAETTKPFTPDLGDFMGVTQLRHFKLGYAGRTRTGLSRPTRSSRSARASPTP